MPDVQIGTVATLWEDPQSGKSYILIIHEALYLGKVLPDTLLTPNQLRANGLTVEDAPKQYDSRSSHSIYSKDSKVCIPLDLQGVISGFESRKPTWEEIELILRLNLPPTCIGSLTQKTFPMKKRDKCPQSDSSQEMKEPALITTFVRLLQPEHIMTAKN
jgi:hypothetical protein